MPRFPRVNIENALYYVTSRSGHAYNIFIDDSDYKEYISLIDKYKKQYGFKLFSYSLLPARLEMLIELRSNSAISNIMHDISSLYTKIYNGKYAKKGHLFQQRFKALIAEKDSYLLQLIRQVHLSPVLDNITRDPKAYQYSSHNAYMDPSKRKFPNVEDEVEEAFKILKGREAIFDKFISQPDYAEIERFKNILLKNKLLGSDGFIEKVKNRIKEDAEARKKNKSLRKVQIIYIVAGSAAILALSIGVTYFYRQNYVLKNKYAVTIDVYKRTLESLKRERDAAVEAHKNIENYAWKIRLTEQALEKTMQEKDRASVIKNDINGSMWKIALTQTSGSPINFQKEDVIYFNNNLYLSNNLSKIGFPSTVYTKTDLKNGIIIWKTIQSNNRNETASWRGEWNGSAIKGVMSFRSSDGVTIEFSFISLGYLGHKAENKPGEQT